MGIFRKSETLELSSNLVPYFDWILWFLFKKRLYLLLCITDPNNKFDPADTKSKERVELLYSDWMDKTLSPLRGSFLLTN